MTVRSAFVRFLALSTLFSAAFAGAASAAPISRGIHSDALATRNVLHGAFVVRQVDGKAVCEDATPVEALSINQRPATPLKEFGGNRGKIRANGGGLDIVLRGTAQLDANPQAKAAFERAAQIWENKIANPITVFVDVDFGTLRFGEPFPDPNIIASASSDFRGGGEGIYPELRPLIVARADNAAETTIYNLLPGATLPTDLGATTGVATPSIQFRAFGALDAEASPTEDAPNIGFNSAFSYDFDPTNGISPGTTDFEGVVVHEIGHMLGFVSRVGSVELGSEINAPTILDFFRFRPGVTNGTFASANRIQSSGGLQVFFTGGTALALSTGRPDGTGGDDNQASHWQDDAISGSRIGIMDPTLASGVRSELTAADLSAFGFLGFAIVDGSTPATPNAPTNLTATATSATVIRLNWNDNSNNETEFRIEQKVGANFTDIGSALANATQVNVTNLSAGQTVTFRVRARNGTANSTYSNEATATTPTGGGACVENATTVCLLSNRFRVSIAYVNPFSNPPNQPGTFLAARLSSTPGINPDVALFGFSSAQAVEVVVRLQDTRPFAPRFDVYYGGMTDVGYTVTVTDTATGTARQYVNTVGNVGGGVDRSSFPTSALGLPDRIITSGGQDSFPAETEMGLTAVQEERAHGRGTPRIEAGLSGVQAQRASGFRKLKGSDLPQIAITRKPVGDGGCSELEPNNSLLLADPLTFGVPCTGNANFGDLFEIEVNYGDSVPKGRVHDLFEVTTDAAGTLTATMTFTNGSADLDVVGFRDTGSGLAGIGNSSTEALTETFTTASLPAGTYYIGVSAYGGGSNYTLTVNSSTTGGGGCTANSTTVCLLNNRFRVAIAYVNPFSNPPNQPGNFLGARLLQGTQNPDTALFGFSSAQAVEVVVRVQDTRPFANRFDIYYGGMTDVGYTVTVTDTQTGTTRQYVNNVGTVGGGVDRNSFPAN